MWDRLHGLFVLHKTAAAPSGQFFMQLEGRETVSLKDRIRILSWAYKWLSGKVDGRDPVWDLPALTALQKRIFRLHFVAGQDDDSFLDFARSELPQGGWGTADASALRLVDCELPYGGAPETAETVDDGDRKGLDKMLGRLLSLGCIHDALNLARVFLYNSKEVILAQVAVLVATEAVSDHAIQITTPFVAGLQPQNVPTTLKLLYDSCQYGVDFFQRMLVNYQVSRTLNMVFRNMMAEPAQKVRAHCEH